MLEYLDGKASERKARLFACACCRRIWHLLPDAKSRKAIELAEKNMVGRAKLREIRRTGQVSSSVVGMEPAHCAVHYAVLGTPKYVGDVDFAVSAAHAVYDAIGDEDNLTTCCNLLRDIFGNPFRPVAINPAWLAWNDGAVQKIAQAIYDERAFDRMPILAEALEEAGCHDPDILGHCRQPGLHVRGCWLVDLLLGKE
jgi:hypothetical protein